MLRLPDSVEKYLETHKEYEPWAYAFIYGSLSHAASLYKLPRNKEAHITAAQLCEAICSLAIQEFGLIAQTVMKQWGIKTTKDLGAVVYVLVQCEMMRQSENDKQEDFVDVFNLMDRLDPNKIEIEYKLLDKHK